MPKFTVEALERFTVRAIYRNVEASSAEMAETLCKTGEAAYDHIEPEEGCEEWLETVSVEEE